jgi:hypothetical protein
MISLDIWICGPLFLGTFAETDGGFICFSIYRWPWLDAMVINLVYCNNVNDKITLTDEAIGRVES